jgi:hypothetical protein
MRARTPVADVAEPATAEGPARRRASWNLRSIVEDVAGRPIEELQDPDRPPHPYLKSRPPSAAPVLHAPTPIPVVEEPEYDPVGRIFPPLVGPGGRAYHGAENEHHRETLEHHAALSGGRPTGPLARPERLYLHYLLLHMDRLSDSSLRYLQTVIQEEREHRSPRATAAPAAPPDPGPPPLPNAAPPPP